MSNNNERAILFNIKMVVKNILVEFDLIFALLFILSYFSSTLSALFKVNSPFTIIVLFGLWFISFLVNTFFIKKRDGGIKKFLLDFITSKRMIELALLILWLIIIVINMFLKRGTNGHIALGYYFIFFSISLIDYCYEITNEKWKVQCIIYISLIIFAIDFLRGSINIIRRGAGGPWDSRQLSTRLYTDEKRRMLQLMGIGGYEVNTGMSILTSSFILYILKTKHYKFMLLLYLICAFGTFMSAYYFPVIFTCLCLFIIFLVSRRWPSKSKSRRAVNIIFFSVAIMYLFLLLTARPLNNYSASMYLRKIENAYLYDIRPKLYTMIGKEAPTIPDNSSTEEDLQEVILTDEAENQASNNVDSISPVAPVDVVLERVITPELLGNVLESGLGPISTRMLLYKQSWITFIENFLFGIGPAVNMQIMGVGGHSSWADYFATYGIQFMSFIGFLICIALRIKNKSNGLERFLRMFGFGVFIVYGFFNPVISHKVFPVVVCLMIGGNLPLRQKDTVNFE